MNIKLIENEMPLSVKDLVKSSDGRRHLAKLQKRYEIDLLQPSNPKFKQVYGDRINASKQKLESQKKHSQELWAEKKKRLEFDSLHPLTKR